MRSSPFVVNVGALRRAPGGRRAERCEGVIPGLAVSTSAVPEGAGVLVDVVIELVPGAAIARGTVEVAWEGDCRRCLGPAAGRLSLDVWEVFEDSHDPEQTYPLHGDRLDLEPMARDAVLLELPLAPLCRADCEGLCPSCGVDRNLDGCDCEQVAGDPRWTILDALRDT